MAQTEPLRPNLAALFRAPEAAPEDLAALDAYVRERSAELLKSLSLALLLGVLAWWPFDLYLYDDDPPTMRALTEWRVEACAVLLGAYVLARASRWVRAHPYHALVVVSLAATAVTSRMTATVGGPGRPFLFSHYLIPMCTLPALVPIRVRVAVVSVMVAASVGSALVAGQEILRLVGIGTFVGMLLASGGLAIFAGQAIYQLFRRNYLQQLALSRTAAELAALNAGLEARVAARTEELRALAAHNADVLEKERARIARDIHDELGQSLTAMRLEVEHGLSTLSDPAPPRTGELKGTLGRTSKLLESTLATSRRILTELRPRVLDDFGLIAAVEWLVEEFRARHGCACELSVDPDLDTDPGRATAIFRIVQECLNNVAKHAGATRVEIALARDGDLIRLVVRDDGKGLGRGPVRAGAMGLLGMRERAWQYDGKVNVAGEPGRGTTVDVEIPADTAPRSVRLAGAGA